MRKFLKQSAFIAGAMGFPALALAHEAYVLTPAQFHEGLSHPGFGALSALNDPGNLQTFLIISFCVLIALVLNFFLGRSRAGLACARLLERLGRFAPFVVRLAISASFFFSALSWSFLGPELPLAQLPFAPSLRAILFAVSIFILFGFLTELAALTALCLYSLALWKFGLYLATYLNYLGEIIVLLLFGLRYLSLDGLLFGPGKRFPKLRPYEGAIVRICYGAALIYAAITIKFLHPILTVTVVNQYHLTRFHYLFPHDPLLVTFGAALAEVAVGLFILIGFELRFTVIISLIYITLSLLYFRELVWPHFLLYGISLNLIIGKKFFSLDNFLERRLEKLSVGPPPTFS